MRNGIPNAYYLFRTAWSVMHLVMLAALLVAVILWSAHDGQGARFIAAWWRMSLSISATIFHALPFLRTMSGACPKCRAPESRIGTHRHRS
jgi:hypothetical protein